METIDLKDAVELKVVEGHELNFVTQNGGWRLIQVLEEEKIDTATATEPNPNYNPSMGYSSSNPGPTLQRSVPKKIKIHRYLLGKDKDSVFGDLQAKLDDALRRMTEAEKGELKVAGQVKDLLKETGEIQKKVDYNKGLYDGVREDLDNKNKVVLKMEQDIAKIRTAIGQDKMTEILER